MGPGQVDVKTTDEGRRQRHARLRPAVHGRLTAEERGRRHGLLPLHLPQGLLGGVERSVKPAGWPR